MTCFYEVNFDGIAAPTHHFGGYAFGNIPSMKHRAEVSHPKKGALQCLEKMKFLTELGLHQAILPPLKRPSIATLHALGFRGSDRQIFAQAARHDPFLLYHLSSSASMWSANWATITPSPDNTDGRIHITVANQVTQFHRSIESEEIETLLRLLFPNENLFAIHPALPKAANFGDEGAANHIRFCSDYGEKGIHLFVYGKTLFEQGGSIFPLRQTKEASEAIARIHGLSPEATIFVQQNRSVIDAGAFHNDVISTGNKNFFLYHEKAFINTDEVVSQLKQRGVEPFCVTESMLPLTEAIKTYFFNGQILSPPHGDDLFLLPSECRHLNLDWLPLRRAFINVEQSMFNGGGPACLRLRCVMNSEERDALHPHIYINNKLYTELKEWIEKHYRDELSWADLQDPLLLDEIEVAFTSLATLLHLGNYYG